MTKKDHLDRETNLSAGVTDNGGELKTNSRFVNAVDRLGGNLIDLPNVLLEKFIVPKRAEIEAEKEMIEATGRAISKRIDNDKEFASRAAEAWLAQGERKLANKIAVLHQTVEMLKQYPSTEEQAKEGPDTLDEDFLNRFERYAEDASSDDARIKWANVLAGEIRRPGMISSKTMRVMDEIDNQLARFFSELACYRTDGHIPVALRKLSYEESANLFEFELISNHTVPIVWISETRKLKSGKEVYFFEFGSVAVSFDKKDARRRIKFKDGLLEFINERDELSIPIAPLTKTGQQIMDLMEDKTKKIEREKKNALLLHEKLLECDPTAALHFKNPNTGSFDLAS